MEYFIYTTNDCNLHCEYCSVLLDCKKIGLPLKPVYSNELLTKFIEQTQKQYEDSEINIYFFGGEPSLECSEIENLINDVNAKLSKKFTIKFILHTNGLLLNELSQKIIDSLNLIMFSINYEKIPKFNLSTGYFSNIMNGIMKIKDETKIPVIARLTITEQTSLYTEILQVLPFFDLVYWQIENCESFKNFETFFASYTFEVQLTFKYWLKALKSGHLIKLVPFMAALKFLFFHDRSDEEFSCGYNRSMVYIQTDGNCYACSDNVESGCHYVGNIEKGVHLNNISLQKLRCKSCQYRSLCMGRCGRMHKEFSESHITEYCKMNQFMFDLFIKHKNELLQIINHNPFIKDELGSELLEYTEFTP